MKCGNNKCEFNWICNNLMSYKALQDDMWCHKEGKNIVK